MRWLAVAIILLAVAGCRARDAPFTYQDQKEMAGRPGLFTGAAGAIVLHRD